MNADQLNKRSLRDQVAEALRDAILLGEFEPGQRLSEPDLAARLGVSLTPVREALNSLAASGLVTREGRRGTHVRRLTAEDVDNLLSVREALEVLAVRQAVPRFGEEQHREFQANVAEQAQATERVREEPAEMMPRLARLNERFHQLFLDHADNPWLVSMITSIQDVVVFARVRLRLVARVERRLESLEEHRDIVRAVLDRDADAAARHMSRHVQRLKAHVLSLVPDSDAPTEAGHDSNDDHERAGNEVNADELR